MKNIQLIVCLLCSLGGLHAAVAPASIFTDHAVLQRDRPVPVWGTAAPGEAVKISFAGQTKTAQADAQGQWHANLDPMPGNVAGEIVLQGVGNTVTLSDVVTGEVWLVGGQSNATMPLKMDLNGAQEAAGADLPNIREFRPAIAVADTPQDACKGNWRRCTPQTAGDFSAMGYFFARQIADSQQVPVGLLNANKGGAPIFSMMSKEIFEANPNAARVLAYMDAAQKRWEKQQQATNAKPHQEPGETPVTLYGKNGFVRASVLFNGMIHPLIPYAMRGVLWNQGEADIGLNAAYLSLLTDMIADWRTRWGEPQMPFLVVQLANISDKMSYDPSGKCWPRIREAQAQAQELPNVWTAVSIDIGQLNDRHPKNKRELGRRLALLARTEVYGEKAGAHSPFFVSATVEGGKIRCTFDAAAKGLKTANGQVPGAFEIAGADKKFVPAQAVIEGESVVVSAPEVPTPALVRYAWSNAAPGANVVNAAGLPLAPFRTGAF